MTKPDINKYFEYFNNPDPSCDGLERLLSINGAPEVFERLENVNALNLNKVQLNQLFIISGLTSMTFGFFKYYWLTFPKNHPYDLKVLSLGYPEKDEKGDEKLITTGGYEKDEIEKYFFETNEKDELIEKEVSVINTLEHLRWGLLRIYSDALLYFGNITTGFNELNKKTGSELIAFFEQRRFDTEQISERGHSLDYIPIDIEERYLISEMACKNLDTEDGRPSRLRTTLFERYKEAVEIGVTEIKVGVLLDKDKSIDARRKKAKEIKDAKKALTSKQIELDLDLEITTSQILDKLITKESDIDEIVNALEIKFMAARKSALQNTKLYLSIINDLDVYVATSMRNNEDFKSMAKNCHDIFHDPNIKILDLRYFDPTLSAAEGHDDKGLIECLMVKCAKVLVYTSGDKDSYGKDAEAAMALSSGKPVIFYCPDDIRYKISKDVHPLTKLIDFKTGVANGAMIAKNLQEVKTLIKRLFANQMRYMLTKEPIFVEMDHGKLEKAYFKLKDTQTASTIRVQTSDLFLSKSFWNYYTRHVKEKKPH